MSGSKDRPVPGKAGHHFAGILVGQVVLYGPSLAGRKILLPLDSLAKPRVYLPMTPQVSKIVEHDHVYSEPGLRQRNLPPVRGFRDTLGAVSAVGALPVCRGSFCGWPKFSPFMLLSCCMASPVILAWTQLVAAMVAGLGAWLFCRRVLLVGFWPATVIAWCYPLTGFLCLLAGTITSWRSCGFPGCCWRLTDVRRASLYGPIGMGAATCLVLICGQLDVAGQVLLASGIYAVWCCRTRIPNSGFNGRQKAVLALGDGWGLGFLWPRPMFAAAGVCADRRPHGAARRGRGRAPARWVVRPAADGFAGHVWRDASGQFPCSAQTIQPESSAAAYAGVLATLLVAPLAWCSRRHRSVNLLLGVAWLLGTGLVPECAGCGGVLRLPGLNMMSHNRFVFATSFAILALAAVGLEACGRAGS